MSRENVVNFSFLLTALFQDIVISCLSQQDTLTCNFILKKFNYFSKKKFQDLKLQSFWLSSVVNIKNYFYEFLTKATSL